MARKLRYFVPYGYYHVYARVTRGEMIFDDEQLSEHWVETIRRVAEEYDLEILAWCLMTNHFHLVIRTGEIPLWSGLARTQVTTSKFHNRLRGVLGPLWQGRYKAKLVDEQSYLEQLFAYVHLNPVAAGLVEDPSNYKLSGHLELIGGAIRRLVNRRSALSVFDVNPIRARERYLNVLRNLAEVRWLQADVRKLPWWREVDDDHQLVEEDQAPGSATCFDGESLPPLDPLVEIGGLVSRFEAIRGLAPGELRSGYRSDQLTRERRLLVLFLVRAQQYSNKEIAELFRRNRSTVTRWLTKAAELSRADRDFSQDFEELQRTMARGSWPPAECSECSECSE